MTQRTAVISLKTFTLVMALGVATPLCAAWDAFSDWGTIQNKRFGFQIAYPANILFPVRSPSGDDGRVLKSKDGRATMIVATFKNEENQTLEAYRTFLLDKIYPNAKIDYGPRKARWFVISGVQKSETFYERITFSCGGRLINSWAMRYPTSEHHLYDRVVEAISKTYTAGSGTDGTCGARLARQ
jgi:hypothetical protein